MNRRHFLRTVISLSVLSLGGVAAFQYHQQNKLEPPQADDFEYSFLTEQDRILLEVFVPVFVASLKREKLIFVQTVIQNIEAAIACSGRSI